MYILRIQLKRRLDSQARRYQDLGIILLIASCRVNITSMLVLALSYSNRFVGSLRPNLQIQETSTTDTTIVTSIITAFIVELITYFHRVFECRRTRTRFLIRVQN